MKPSRNISLITILLAISILGFSQDELISPNFLFQYFKNSENQRILKTTLTYTQKRREIPLRGFEIQFYADINKKNLLGKSVTDDKGLATFTIPDDANLPIDKNNFWNFSSEFKGNDTIESATSELSIKDVNLEMELTLVDSVKTVILKANTVERGKVIPAAGESVLLYVPRMFSLLPAGEGTLEDNGTTSVEFPTDIPGDKDGNITIIARFEDHPTFGNVEKRAIINWGVSVKHISHLEHRALWTKGAPTWMIVALSIMLAGVWGHYLYAVICLIRIKLLSKTEDPLKDLKEKKKEIA